MTPDPIYAAVALHRVAHAAYDAAAKAPDEENDEAFRSLDTSSQALMRAEASTLAGLTALQSLRGSVASGGCAPGLPMEVPFAGRWSAAYSTFCANVAERFTVIAATKSEVTPEFVDYVGDAIVVASADLFDDFEVVRRIARAAI